MKSLLPSRTLIAVAFSLTACLQAQPQDARTPPPMGLLRLKSETKPNETAPLAVTKFRVDDLTASGVAGARNGKRNDVDYLAIESGTEWARPLRGNTKDVTFVSFQVYASQTTTIDIAGARLGLTAGPIPGTLQVMYDDSAMGALQWKALNYHVPTAKFDNRSLAELPTLTVRIDPNTGTWDLYAASRLLAVDLPLIEAKKNDRRISIRAGSEGAWIIGLVLSDENPIYDDVNANGIDDHFEKQQRAGQLLATTAPKAERQLLAEQWKVAQRAKPPQAFFSQRPLPDASVASRSR